MIGSSTVAKDFIMFRDLFWDQSRSEKSSTNNLFLDSKPNKPMYHRNNQPASKKKKVEGY